jgi:hypothetical protein
VTHTKRHIRKTVGFRRLWGADLFTVGEGISIIATKGHHLRRPEVIHTSKNILVATTDSHPIAYLLFRLLFDDFVAFLLVWQRFAHRSSETAGQGQITSSQHAIATGIHSCVVAFGGMGEVESTASNSTQVMHIRLLPCDFPSANS